MEVTKRLLVECKMHGILIDKIFIWFQILILIIKK